MPGCDEGDTTTVLICSYSCVLKLSVLSSSKYRVFSGDRWLFLWFSSGLNSKSHVNLSEFLVYFPLIFLRGLTIFWDKLLMMTEVFCKLKLFLLLYHEFLLPTLVHHSFPVSISCFIWIPIIMQGPLSTTFPIENRNVPVTTKSLKNHLDRTKNLLFAKRISDFHLLLLLARFLDINADVPALAECVSRQEPVPDGYKLLIESVACSSWDALGECKTSERNSRR